MTLDFCGILIQAISTTLRNAGSSEELFIYAIFLIHITQRSLFMVVLILLLICPHLIKTCGLSFRIERISGITQFLFLTSMLQALLLYPDGYKSESSLEMKLMLIICRMQMWNVLSSKRFVTLLIRLRLKHPSLYIVISTRSGRRG